MGKNKMQLSDGEDVAIFLGVLLGLLLSVGLAVSSFVTFTAGLFFDYPFTWVNIFKTWAGLVGVSIISSAIFKK